jgi:hypothetical protein
MYPERPRGDDAKYFCIGAARKVSETDSRSPLFLADRFYGLKELREAVLRDPGALPKIADRLYSEILADNILRRETLNSVFIDSSSRRRAADIVAVTEALARQEDRLMRIIALRTPLAREPKELSAANRPQRPPSPPPGLPSAKG